MIPVDQTTFGHPGGNCFSACVASLLEIPISEVPYFMGAEEWYPGFLDWLRPRGFHAVTFRRQEAWAPEGPCILGGKSTRGDHAVVGGKGYRVVFDPHPSRDGLISVEDVTLLVPFDPSHTTRAVMREIAEFRRASGDVLCETCGAPYRKHPLAREPEALGFDGPFLNRLCNGELVKL